jgi:hypothetical protein
MKKILSAITIAAMLGTGSMAFAQSEVTQANSYAGLIDAIPLSGSSDLSSLASEDQVVIVLVSSLETTAPGTELDNSLSTNAAATDSMRTNISANEFITAKLAAEGYSAENVIAISVDNTGNQVTVYVDNRAS